MPPTTSFSRSAFAAVSLTLVLLGGTTGQALAQTDPAAAQPAAATDPAPTVPAPVEPVVTQPPVAVPASPALEAVTFPATQAPKAVAKPKAKARPKAKVRKVAPQVARPVVAGRGSMLLDVDISSQTMRVSSGGKLLRTVKVSTGSGKRFCAGGKCQTAHTPRGNYSVFARHNGWHTSYLGKLYSPLYFKGGYAIHGAGSVPSYPASHGCVRVTVSTAQWLASVVPNGARVSVHD